MFLFYFGSASFLSWHHHWGAKSITVNSSWKGLVRQACLPSPKMFHHNFSPQYGWDNDGGETHLKIEAMRHISLNLIKWEYTLLGQKKKIRLKTSSGRAPEALETVENVLRETQHSPLLGGSGLIAQQLTAPWTPHHSQILGNVPSQFQPIPITGRGKFIRRRENRPTSYARN